MLRVTRRFIPRNINSIDCINGIKEFLILTRPVSAAMKRKKNSTMATVLTLRSLGDEPAQDIISIIERNFVISLSTVYT